MTSACQSLPASTVSDDVAPEASDVVSESAPGGEVLRAPHSQNVLLVIADDMGVDKVSVYAERDYPEYAEAAADTLPATPNIDGLADAGVRFTQAWSNPTCSPTRAGLYTGRHAFRTGVGEPVLGENRAVLELGEITIAEAVGGGPAEAFGAATYASGLFGKWHLGTAENRPEELADDAPRQHGWQTFYGFQGGSVVSYHEWEKLEDATVLPNPVTDYVTSVTVRDALGWIQQQSGPWMATVSLNAPHEAKGDARFERPPASCAAAPASGDDVDLYRSIVECLDAELGLLLAGIPSSVLDNTTVIFVGDNGTERDLIDDAFEGAGSKGTLFEGGVHVPLIIADGYHLQGERPERRRVAAGHVDAPGRAVNTPVHTTDLFSTLAEIARAPHDTGVDSTSLVPLLASPEGTLARSAIYTESFDTIGRDEGESTSGTMALRGERFKLIAEVTYPGDPCAEAFVYSPTHLYDLADDQAESKNLLDAGEAEAALDELLDAAATLHASWADESCGG